MLRTPVATLLSSVDLDGIPTPVSTEYFAASGDAHLVLGHIRENDYSCDTPDHKEKTRGASLRRLARVVCADLEEIGENGARQIAEAFWERQQALVCDAVHRVTKETETTTVVVAGLGSALFARVLRGIDLSQEIRTSRRCAPSICRQGGGTTEAWKLSLGLLAGSIGITAVLWSLHLPFFFLFLCIPIFPFLGKRQVKRCPVCGWETTGSENFCPADGTALLGPGGDGRQ